MTRLRKKKLGKVFDGSNQVSQSGKVFQNVCSKSLLAYFAIFAVNVYGECIRI